MYIRSKIAAIAVVIFISSNIYCQEFKPLLNTPYFDILTNAIPTEEGGFVAMETIPGIDLQTWQIKQSSDINNYGYSNITEYNENGVKIKSLKLPDTDSTIFFTVEMILLSNGKYCIAGDHLNSNSGAHNLFFAIVNESLNGFDNINIIPLPGFLSCGSVLEYYNGDLIFLMSDDDGNIKQFKQDGSFVREYDLSQCGTSGNKANVIYKLDKNLILYCTILDRFIVLDENFIESTIDVPYFNSLNNKKIRNLGHEAVLLNSNEIIFKASITDTTNIFNDSVYATIFKLDNQFNVSPFFNDTSKSINSNTFNYSNPIAINEGKNIYFVYNNDILNKSSFTIYCLNTVGDLKWKKFITADLSTSQNTGFLTANFITNDGGFVFTVFADDNYGEADTYYYKIDSNGNQVDFPTGIFSLGPKLKINDFLLFPNPVQEVLNIETSLQGSFKLKIFNVLGKQISSHEISNETQIHMKDLHQGNYFYQIINEKVEAVQTGKFLKE